MRIIGRPPFAARGRRPPPPSARQLSGSSTPSFVGVERDLLERIEHLDRRVEPLLRAPRAKPSTRDAPPLSMMRSMRSDDGGRLEEVEGLLDLEQHVLGHRVQHRLRRPRRSTPSTGSPFFSCSALSNGRFSSFCTASV